MSTTEKKAKRSCKFLAGERQTPIAYTDFCLTTTHELAIAFRTQHELKYDVAKTCTSLAPTLTNNEHRLCRARFFVEGMSNDKQEAKGPGRPVAAVDKRSVGLLFIVCGFGGFV